MTLDLNYEGFENYLLEREDRSIGYKYERIHYIFKFDNNYGASVVKGYGSYGYEDDRWELAVILFNPGGSERYDLVYNTPITDDVLGYLTDEGVREILQQIKEL